MNKQETQQITEQNFTKVLKYNGFEGIPCSGDHVLFKKHADNESTSMTVCLHINYKNIIFCYQAFYGFGEGEIIKTKCFEVFLAFLQFNCKLKPLPRDETLLEWWEKNKVEGFALNCDRNSANYGKKWHLLCNFDGNPGSTIYGVIHVDWTLEKQKDAILKLIEIYKD